LCKTGCNARAIDGRPLGDDFVCFAFGLPTRECFYTYLTTRFTMGSFRAELNHIFFEDLFDPATNDTLIRLNFYGLDWLFANYDLHRFDVLYLTDNRALCPRDYMKTPRLYTVDRVSLSFKW
jgi:hypothetical protein